MRAPEQNNDLKFETWIVCVDETNKKICGLAHIRWGYKLVGGVVTQLYAIDGTNSQTDAQIRTALSNSGFSAWSFSRNAWDCCPLAGERALDREDYHCKADSANDLHIRYYSDTKMRLTAHYDSTFRSFTATPNADSSSWECTWAGDTIYKCHWEHNSAKDQKTG